MNNSSRYFATVRRAILTPRLASIVAIFWSDSGFFVSSSAMMFSIVATLSHWRINPRRWLLWYLKTCAASGGKAPPDARPFLPWNLTPDQLASLQTTDPSHDLPTA